MKILFDHSSPFLLAHGGFQIQINQTKRALEKAGVDVEFLRWWDADQRGDLIHYFSTASNAYLRRARGLNLPVVMTTLFTETCNRTPPQLGRQRLLKDLLLALPGGEGIKDQLVWRSFQLCAHNVVGLEAERQVLQQVYGVAPDKISVIPLGLSEAYLQAGRGDRSGSHLIYTGTITERKNCVELAEMAHATQIPVLFVGKAYHLDDPYWLRFEKLIDGQWVRHHPHVADEREMIGLLHKARGFVLLSDFENWCLSAHEAVACGLPLLAPDQPWSRECFGDQARYFSKAGGIADHEILRTFYREAPDLAPPQIQLYAWSDTAEKLGNLYRSLLS